MFIWIHGMQKFVMFVLGDVLGRFATKIQFASTGIFSSFGPSVCRSMSCPFWVICSCASRLHSDDRLCLNQVGGADNKRVAPMAS
jgi:hypothetical protein